MSSYTLNSQMLPAYHRWGDVGTATTRLSPKTIDWLIQKYIFRDNQPDEVLAFIEQYPFLATLLVDMYLEIKTFFPNGRISLELMSEPDSDSEDELHLTAYVETKLNPVEALRKLRDFDQAWWLDALPRAQGRLSIDVEFA